jgi:hypothetical protein
VRLNILILFDVELKDENFVNPLIDARRRLVAGFT